jgi:hypothetical protein
MCFKWLSNIFNPQETKPAPTPTSEPAFPSIPWDSPDIPHPEEPVNNSATLANTDTDTIFNKWLSDWIVPSQNHGYWKTAIDIQVYDVYPASIIAMGISQEIPAATWSADGKRHLAIKTKWFNPGVIAHEQAHNSYWLLKEEKKKQFAIDYKALKKTDRLMKLIFSRQVTTTDDVEAHAEIYRYLGQYMPAQLKIYYPSLF